jgi:hypothetical protein
MSATALSGTWRSAGWQARVASGQPGRERRTTNRAAGSTRCQRGWPSAALDLHRQRLTEDLVQLSRLVKLDDPADLAWTRMSRSSIRVTRAQLDELGAELQALMLKYAAPKAGQPTTGGPTTGGPTAEASTADEATELIQLRLYAFREQGTQPDAAQHLAGEQPDWDLRLQRPEAGQATVTGGRTSLP